MTLLVIVAEHMLHNDEVVVNYEILISFVLFVCIQVDGIAHVIQASRQLDSLRAERVLFSWYYLDKSIYRYPWNWMVYF